MVKPETHRSTSVDSGRISRRAGLRKSMSTLDLKRSEHKKSFGRSKD